MLRNLKSKSRIVLPRYESSRLYSSTSLYSNPFRVLGVKPDASEQEVKVAYHKLSKIHHPDKGGDSSKFKEISNAYHSMNFQPHADTVNAYRSNESSFKDLYKDFRKKPTREEDDDLTGMGKSEYDDLTEKFFQSKQTGRLLNVSDELLRVIYNPRSSSSGYVLVSEYVAYLLQHGANPNRRNIAGDSLLHILVKNKSNRSGYSWDNIVNEMHRIVAHLEKAGADLFALNSKGKTPWYYAIKQPCDSFSSNFKSKFIYSVQDPIGFAEWEAKVALLRAEGQQAIEETMVNGKPHPMVANALECLEEQIRRHTRLRIR